MSNLIISPEEARHRLWQKANLSYLLDENQMVLYNMYKTTKEKIIVWNLARGSGKSHTLCILAIEECLKNPKAVVKYCCASQTDAEKIVKPLFRQLLEHCPLDIKPRFIVREGLFRFPNGAVIQLQGLDKGKAESLRGGSSVLGIIDEAGTKSLTDLEYIVSSILFPAVTRTQEINGKIILASTPPVSADHPFVRYLRKAEIDNTLVTRNIYTNPRITPEMLESIIKQFPEGINSTGFKREYLCEIVVSEEDAVIPEFTTDLQNKIIREWPKPPFFDSYVAMDLGLKDLTVVLFAYYDFKHQKVVIEDEFSLNGKKFNTQALADAIKEKEKMLFCDPNTGEQLKAYKRISDNNLIVINDLYQLHNLTFLPTKKDDADAALNNLRMMLAAEKIIINPRCKILIRHLRDATWNKQRTSFARSADNGHYDACFTAETPIITSKGLKPIHKIVEGDLVLTHKGNFKRVTALLEREYKGHLLEIKTYGRPKFRCTPDHKLLTVDIKKTQTGLISKTPRWQEASLLTKYKQCLLVPKNKNIEKTDISLNECFTNGLHLSDYSFDFLSKLDLKQSLHFLCGFLFKKCFFGKKDLRIITLDKDLTYKLEFLANKLGLSGSINPVFRNFKWFGLPRKKEMYSWVLHKYDLRRLYSKLRKFPFLRTFVKHKFNKKTLNLQRLKQISSRLKRVQYIKEDYFSGKVYSLEVEDDHSYTVCGLGVKNCDALKYLIRNIDLYRNPYPVGYDAPFNSNYYHTKRKKTSEYETLVKTIMGIKINN